MIHQFYSQLAIIALAICCGLAIWKGGAAERTGALLILATWVVTTVITVASKSNLSPTVFLISDAFLAAGLLILAVRFSNWWMGAAMLLQAIGLSLHAAYFAADQSEMGMKLLRAYVLGKNLASLGMLLVLLAATIMTMVKRSRRQGLAPSAAIPA
jgi:hypothetical protein